MARIAGYSEEDLDVLEVEFAAMLQRSIERVATQTAESLTPVIVGSFGAITLEEPDLYVFHLPGQHDQLTHGRSRQREMKVLQPYGDWGGGKAGWMASDDVHARSTQLWSGTYEAQIEIRGVMERAHAGEVDPAAGVRVTGPLAKQAQAFHYETGEKYGEDAIRDDIFNAAMHLDSGLEGAPTVQAPLFRGMRVENPSERFKVGDTFDSQASSWSTQRRVADHYTGISAEAGRTSAGRPVIMRIQGGAKALNIDDGSLGGVGAGHGEHLVRGKFKIVGVTREAGTETMIVTVEQLWQTA
jgi:hypothetical protein